MIDQSKRSPLPMEFDDVRHEAVVGLWWTGMLLGKCADKVFGEFGLSVAKFNLMTAVKHSDDPLNQRELSEQLFVDKSGLTGLVDRLAKQGLIRREDVPGDRRSCHVLLTPKGRKLIDRVYDEYSHLVEEIMSGVSDRQLPQLQKMTELIRAATVEKMSELSGEAQAGGGA